MRLSRATGYALHALVHLARQAGKGTVSTRAIAEATGIPVVFLLKALKPCVDRQLLVSVTGPHGGYRLARPAARISVLEVIEAVDGPFASTGGYHTGRPGSAVDAAVEKLLRDAVKQVRRVFGGVSLAQLAQKRRGRSKSGKTLASHYRGP
jgi:Rrf2 family protein